MWLHLPKPPQNTAPTFRSSKSLEELPQTSVLSETSSRDWYTRACVLCNILQCLIWKVKSPILNQETRFANRKIEPGHRLSEFVTNFNFPASSVVLTGQRNCKFVFITFPCPIFLLWFVLFQLNSRSLNRWSESFRNHYKQGRNSKTSRASVHYDIPQMFSLLTTLFTSTLTFLLSAGLPCYRRNPNVWAALRRLIRARGIGIFCSNSSRKFSRALFAANHKSLTLSGRSNPPSDISNRELSQKLPSLFVTLQSKCTLLWIYLQRF